MNDRGVSTPARSVVRGYYLLAGLYTLAASIIWGVNTLFLLDAGLSVSEVFVANAAFSAGMVAFEIPTGVVADTLGRRASFLLSVAVLTVTTVGYLLLAQVGAGVVAFAAMSVVMGLGFTFYSGAVEAWLVDALRHVGFMGGLDDVFARGQIVTGGAMLIGTVGGGLVGQVDLAVPYVVRAILLALLFVAAFRRMTELGFVPRRLGRAEILPEMRAVAGAGMRFGWRHRSLRLLMFVAAVQAAFLSFGFYAWQPYFLELLGRDAVWMAGVVSALVALALMGGNAVVEYLSRFCGRRSTLMLWASAALVAGGVGVGLAGSFWPALGALLVAMTAMGVIGPVRQAYLHEVVPTEQRATVLSFDSLVSGVGSTGGQVGLGALAQARGFAPAYVVGGLITAAALPLVGLVRRRGGAADVIVGRRAGVEGSCAAQGLPSVATVEPVPVE